MYATFSLFTCQQALASINFSFTCIPRNKTTGSYSHSIFNFYGNGHAASHSSSCPFTFPSAQHKGFNCPIPPLTLLFWMEVIQQDWGIPLRVESVSPCSYWLFPFVREMSTLLKHITLLPFLVWVLSIPYVHNLLLTYMALHIFSVCTYHTHLCQKVFLNLLSVFLTLSM